MEVALVCFGRPGGSAVAAAQLALHLAARGHRVHVVAAGRPPRLERPPSGILLHRVEIPRLPALAARPEAVALAGAVARVVRSHRVQVVHAHYALPHAFAAAAARQMLPPGLTPRLVVTLQGTDATHAALHPDLAGPLAWSLRAADAVTAVSAALARLAEQRLGLAGVEVIPNFVDPAACPRRPDPALRARLAAPGELLLLHASNLRPVKRAADAVRVLARVVRTRPARLAVLGSGPDLPRLRREAERLGVADRVHLLGHQAEVAPFLAAADAFLLPSESEGCSLALLEAMACGLPAVATRVGGTPEVLVEGVTGFLHPVGDVEGMAASCLRLADPGLRAALGRAARRRVLQRFAAGRVVPRYERLYTALAGASRTSADPKRPPPLELSVGPPG